MVMQTPEVLWYKSTLVHLPPTLGRTTPVPPPVVVTEHAAGDVPLSDMLGSSCVHSKHVGCRIAVSRLVRLIGGSDSPRVRPRQGWPRVAVLGVTEPPQRGIGKTQLAFGLASIGRVGKRRCERG